MSAIFGTYAPFSTTNVNNFLESTNYFGEELHLQICHLAIRNEVPIFAHSRNE